jgi:hypothetical protein
MRSLLLHVCDILNLFRYGHVGMNCVYVGLEFVSQIRRVHANEVLYLRAQRNSTLLTGQSLEARGSSAAVSTRTTTNLGNADRYPCEEPETLS